MAKEGPGVWRELGGATALAEIGVVDPGSVDSFVQQTLETRDPRAVSFVWYLMTMETWVRNARSSERGEVNAK